MSEERATYTFGPLERRGLLGPMRGGQAALLAAGALLAVAALDAAPSMAGALTALVVLSAAAALTTLPLGGRTADQWTPVAVAFALRRGRGRARFRSAAPAAGGTPDPPPSLRDITITERDYRGRTIGVVSERAGRRLTAVLACRVVSFALLDAEAQERRLARWGLVLSTAAGSAVRRIQWVERTVPARGDELARWLHAERDPALPPRGTPMIESYLELIGSTAPVTQEHELLIAVQVDAGRVRERGSDASGRALLESSERVAERLRAAEVDVVGALGPEQLARVLRTAFDPYARAELAALQAADPARDGVSEAGAWPLGADERWDSYRTDGAEHVTYWIGGWPRVEVSPMFMDALLGRSNAVRTVAVTFEPLPTDRSTREVEAAVTRDRADRELRHRFGQSETARQRQAQEATARREAELAAGHCETRLAGFITVSGRDPEDLRRACAEVLEHAARARLELHRMYGQQADAFTFTLPLCRGLK
ncbi:MAG TPA: SCO6880 family protein [Solirubrobacteraceae bacterium]|nr:SCO6880 family protein [Solirubrobacteraceae bacterium]